MQEVTLKVTKRKAIPYIVNLKCECGGNFSKSIPIAYDYETNTIKHTCENCGRVINSKYEFPYSMNLSDEPEEEYGTFNVLEGCKNTIGL